MYFHIQSYHKSNLKHMDGTYALKSFPCWTTTFFDHRPVTRFSRNTTKLSKEAWHVLIPRTTSKGCLIPFWWQQWLVPHQWGRAGLCNISLCHHVHGIIKPHYNIYFIGAFPVVGFTVLHLLQVLKTLFSGKKGASFQTQQVSGIHLRAFTALGMDKQDLCHTEQACPPSFLFDPTPDSSWGGDASASFCWSCWDGSLMGHMFTELLEETCDPDLAP